MSLKMVGTWTVTPLTSASTSLRTSDSSGLAKFPPPPSEPCSDSSTSNTGPRPVRSISLPHDQLERRQAAATSGRITLDKRCRLVMMSLLPNPGRDEDQELGVVLVPGIGLEQPAEERNAMQERRPHRRLAFELGEDAADHRGVAIGHQHRGHRALRIDRRNRLRRAGL